MLSSKVTMVSDHLLNVYVYITILVQLLALIREASLASEQQRRQRLKVLRICNVWVSLLNKTFFFQSPPRLMEHR